MKDGSKEQKQQLEDSIAEHRFMSESGNYDRLVLSEIGARTIRPNRSASGTVVESDKVLQAGSSTFESKEIGSSKSKTLESRRGKHRTHTRRRKGFEMTGYSTILHQVPFFCFSLLECGTKSRTLSQTGTQDLSGIVPGTGTKDRTLEHSSGTQGLKGDSILETDAVYTDKTLLLSIYNLCYPSFYLLDHGILITDEEIYEPIGEDFDSDEFSDDDDDGWSSSEFEEYMEDPPDESAPVPEKPLPPPPSKGGAKQEKNKLLNRLSSFRIKSEDLDPDEEEGPCLPLTINQTKHPPPELPKTPPHLSQIQFTNC
ncbi:hypothetical protein KUTeg_017374 [Tegillarca granosa]|uniref:Uncharacterized protein n=1 Tax=Tegillarca granosa TaxID=220873 RepID=A0ABQ9EIR7_TEGGR|nr:hypothetical protein KUTeg_017374 [Tegillarca granosa]